MKTYQITEIINHGETKANDYSEQTEFISMRCRPKAASAFDIMDATPCVVTIFKSQNELAFNAIHPHIDNPENLAKFNIHIRYNEFVAPNPFYVNGEDGKRMTYRRPGHKDFGKDVIANKMPIAILSTGDDKLDEERMLDAFTRAYARIAEQGLLVDLAEPSKLEYNDAKPRSILARAGVVFGNATDEELGTTE